MDDVMISSIDYCILYNITIRISQNTYTYKSNRHQVVIMPIMGMKTALVIAGKLMKGYCGYIESMNVSNNVKRKMRHLLISMVFDEVNLFYQVSEEASSLKANTDEALKELVDDIYFNFVLPMLVSHLPYEQFDIENPQQILVMKYKKVTDWFTWRKRVAINLNKNTTTIVPRYFEQYL